MSRGANKCPGGPINVQGGREHLRDLQHGSLIRKFTNNYICFYNLLYVRGVETRVAESEVFGWSRIPDNTGSRSRIFLSDSGCPIG